MKANHATVQNAIIPHFHRSQKARLKPGMLCGCRVCLIARCTVYPSPVESPTHVAIHMPPRSMGKPSTHHNQLKVVVANAPRAIQMCVKESKRMGQSSPPVTADAGLVDGMLMLWGGGAEPPTCFCAFLEPLHAKFFWFS